MPLEKGCSYATGAKLWQLSCHEERGEATEMPKPTQIDVGRPLPSGAYHRHGGVNFSLFSRNATRVWLELFERPEDAEPAMAIELDPQRNRTGDMWHVWLKGVTYGQLYAFRVEGPYLPEKGHRFNRRKLLLDPYSAALHGTSRWDLSRALGFDVSSPLKDLTPCFGRQRRNCAEMPAHRLPVRLGR